MLMTMREGRGTAQARQSDAVPRYVEIKMVSPGDAWPALEVVLSELLARLQVAARFSSVSTLEMRHIMGEHPGEPVAAARVWIDLRDPARVTLYLTGDKADRVLIRQVPLVSRLDEVAREEIAHIVEATVDALLVGARIGVGQDEVVVKKPAPVSAPVEKPAHGPSLDLGIGYEVLMWSNSRGPVHGPAVFLGVAGRAGPLRPGVWISGELRIPTTIAGDPISTRLDQGAVRALFVGDWAASAKWLVRTGVGGGVDFVRISPEVAQGALVELEPAYVALAPMLRGLASVRYTFTTRSELFGGLAIDVDLFDTRYLVQRDGREDVVFHPWQVRPMALVGVASDVLAH